MTQNLPKSDTLLAHDAESQTVGATQAVDLAAAVSPQAAVMNGNLL